MKSDFSRIREGDKAVWPPRRIVVRGFSSTTIHIGIDMANGKDETVTKIHEPKPSPVVPTPQSGPI